MTSQPIQNFYDLKTAVCYGCGRSNEHGLHIQSFWDGAECTAHFTPKPYHTAFPGVLYGGIIASVIDCHSIGTAIAAMYQQDGREPGTEPEITCVTANLNVTFLKPTPIKSELVLKAHIKEITPKKAIVICSIFADDIETVKAETVAVRVVSRAGIPD